MATTALMSLRIFFPLVLVGLQAGNPPGAARPVPSLSQML